MTLRSLYALQWPLDRKLGGPQSHSGRCGEHKSLPLPGIESRSLGHPSRSIVCIMTKVIFIKHGDPLRRWIFRLFFVEGTPEEVWVPGRTYKFRRM
jgi:hypothetical protein